MSEPVFHCTIRDMPVASDCTDCLGCPHRTRGCKQFAEHFQANKLRALGLLPTQGESALAYHPKTFHDQMKGPDVTE